MENSNGLADDRIIIPGLGEFDSKGVFQLIVASLSDLISIRDANYKLVYVSPSVSQFTGYSEKYIFEQGLEGLIHPDDKSPTLTKLKADLEDQRAVSVLHFRIKIANGRYVWLEQKIERKYAPDGKHLYSVTISRDITEKKLIEQVANEQQKNITSLLSNPAGYVIYQLLSDEKNETMKVTNASPSISEILGISEEQILNYKEWFANIFPEDRVILENARETGSKPPFLFDLEVRLTHPRKGKRWIQIKANGVPFPDNPGKPEYVNGIIVDITTQKENEEKLADNEKTLGAIFQNAPFMMALLDENSKIIQINEAWEKFSGHPVLSMLGKKEGFLLDCINSVNNPDGCGNSEICSTCELKNIIQKTILTGNPVVKEEVTVYTLNNGKEEKKTLSISCSVIIKNNKKHVLVTTDDITDRKNAENALKKHREHLELEVKKRTTELEDINAKLKEEIKKHKETAALVQQSLEKEKELNKMKTEFVSMVSHEFRTPLTTILGSADLLEMKGFNWEEEKFFGHITKIQKAVDIMTHMLNEVITISRAERNIIKLTPVSTDLYLLCKDIIEEEKRRAPPEHEVIFNFHVSPALLEVDPNLIRQFLGNLLSNAIKFTPDNKPVTLNVEKTEDILKFTVIDKGIGIRDEEIDKIMEPFIRGKDAVNIQGTGLGMTIIRNAVDIYQGKIEFSSEFGKGSVFIVSIKI